MSEVRDLVTRRAALEEIFRLRRDVLRPGRPIEAARFPGDAAPETIHVGAFYGARNIGCATATRVDWEGKPAWQLRGMGIASDWQKKGVGQQLLGELETLVRQASDIRVMWCNGRQEAVGFYQKLGWRIASEAFHIEDVGPHHKMLRDL
jgi:GNAT superfamily N-acetyltransferase